MLEVYKKSENGRTIKLVGDGGNSNEPMTSNLQYSVLDCHNISQPRNLSLFHVFHTSLFISFLKTD